MTQQTTNETTEREAFEKAMNEKRFFPRELDFTMTKSPSGRDEYANGHLESCWVGWQARAALPPPAEPVQGMSDADKRLLAAAKVYAFNYCQDEAEDEEDCVCGAKQHTEAKELFAAIAAVEASAARSQQSTGGGNG